MAGAGDVGEKNITLLEKGVNIFTLGMEPGRCKSTVPKTDTETVKEVCLGAVDCSQQSDDSCPGQDDYDPDERGINFIGRRG